MSARTGRLLPYGPGAWLVDGLDDPAALASEIVAAGVAGVRELVPAESSLLVMVEPSALRAVAGAISAVAPLPPQQIGERTVEIPVIYDGDDLAEVAATIACSVDEVIDRHLRSSYRVAFCGFSPGFAYLRGLDPGLHLPRRASPRTSVAAGSVAIAAGYTAVYPSPTPGGWHLIGTTSRQVWSPDSDPPALLVPGTTVRFVAA